MKRPTRILTFILALILASAFFSLHSGADETLDEEYFAFDEYECESKVLSNDLMMPAAMSGNEPPSWAEDYARFSVNMKIMSCSFSYFYPDTAVSRAEAVHALAKIDNQALSSVSYTGYTDVSASDKYAPAIVWAKNNGIASGYGDGKFQPNSNVSRQEMAVMVYRYLKNYKNMSLSPEMQYPVFSDDSSIASWAETEVKAICRVGIMAGYDDGEFKPEYKLTRASASVMYTRIHAYVYNGSHDICLYVTDSQGYPAPYAYAFFYRDGEGIATLPDCMKTADSKGIIRLPWANPWFWYGVNVVGTTTSVIVNEQVWASRSYIFVHLPTSLANGIPGKDDYYPTGGWTHNPNLCIIKHDLAICYAGIMNQSQNFGWRYLNGTLEYHQGLDISYYYNEIKNPFDHALRVVDVLSPTDSEYTKSKKGYGSYGYYITVKSEKYQMYFTFQHLSDVYCKTITGTIAPGTVFCKTGNSGYGYGAHLHVSVSDDGSKFPSNAAEREKFCDPRIYLK